MQFDLDEAVLTGKEVYLVFDGIKMAADISLNGGYLGYSSDQFLRYVYPVGALLKPAGNELVVSFTTSLDGRNNESRWAACTGWVDVLVRVCCGW